MSDLEYDIECPCGQDEPRCEGTITLTFDVYATPAEPMTRDYPGCDAEIEIDGDHSHTFKCGAVVIVEDKVLVDAFIAQHADDGGPDEDDDDRGDGKYGAWIDAGCP